VNRLARLCAPWLSIGLLLPTAVAAQRSTDYETPRTMALGTGAAASARSSSAAALGAATLPWLRAYHVETAAGYAPSGEGGWWVGGAVTDSITNRLAASLSVRGLSELGSADYSGVDARLSLALPLSERIGLGLAVRYANLSPDQASDGIDPGTHGATVDASLAVRPSEQFAVLLFGRNLVDRGTALLPRQLGGSAALTLGEVLTVGADAWAQWRPDGAVELLAGGGLEYFAGGSVPLRLGYRYEQGGAAHFLTGGIGYVESRVSVDVAMRQGISGAAGTELLLAFRYHVQ